MNVHKQMDLSALQSLLNHLLHRVDFRRHLATWVHPLSIQIKARQAAPVVTDDHTVRIQHGHHFKYEVVP